MTCKETEALADEIRNLITDYDDNLIDYEELVSRIVDRILNQ